MRSSMNIFSREAKCRLSCSSPLRISSSRRSRLRVLSTDLRSTSLTLRKWGFLSSMTQQLGEMFTSQSVQA